MPEETRPRGRAVGPPTVVTLTMPDGSRKLTASRSILDERVAFEWLKILAGENPTKWHDWRELHRFITGGEPLGGKIGKHDKRNYRKLLARMKRIALSEGEVIVTKRPKMKTKEGELVEGSVSHFRLSTHSPEDKVLVIQNAVKDRSMEKHFGGKAKAHADYLDVEVVSFDDFIEQRRQNSLNDV